MGHASTPAQHLTCHGDNVLAAVDRGRAGAGGSTVIMGSATRLTGIHIAQNWHTRLPRSDTPGARRNGAVPGAPEI